EFRVEETTVGWTWQGQDGILEDLPLPALPGRHQLDNAAGVIMALKRLEGRIPVDEAALRRGLETVTLSGRQQQLERNGVTWLLDVAHNPHAVARLAERLRSRPVSGRTLAVLGMLGDKEVEQAVALMKDQVQEWHLAGIHEPRGLDVTELARRVAAAGVQGQRHTDVGDAVRAVIRQARAGDRVVVFGSFFTVAETLARLENPAGTHKS
ncbi:glutamate ligase domain-containing protein, partial [Thiolapillus sp.]